MGEVLLSASMIVRNEATHLEACLRSIRRLVDEIVVVDTGSTDDTPDIARRFGARLHRFEWRDDFAAARNEALDRSRGAWVLYIDADERVRPTSRQRLRDLLASPSLVGCYVRLRPRTGYTPYREMRLFRNDPRIRFEGVIHETIWPGLNRYRAEAGGELGDSALVLDHVGYDGPQDHKHDRNLRLLLKALERDPDRVYCWYHLGTVYRERGEPARAREAWRSGLAAVRRQRVRRWADSLPYVELIQLGLEDGEDVDIDALLEEGLGLFPDHAHLLWLRGFLRLRRGHYEEAIEDFVRLARWRTAHHAGDEAVGYSERLFGVATYEALAVCHFRLGRFAMSRRYFERAERCEPDRLDLKAKKRLCVERAKAERRPRRHPPPPPLDRW